MTRGATHQLGWLLAARIACVASALSCGGAGRDGVTSPAATAFTPVLSWVKVSVSPLNVEVGKSATATGEAFDQNGGSFNAGAFAFTSSAPAIASVDAGGRVTGVAPGAATISASVGGKSASHEVTVVPVAVAYIKVAPDALTLDPGAAATLTATLFDAAEGVLAGRAVSWSSSDTMVALVNSAGRVSARASGRAKITAAADTRFQYTVVTVTGAVGSGGDMLVSFAVPYPGEIVGDTLEVYADVSTSQAVAKVEATFDGLTIPLVKAAVGALGGAWLWHGVFDISGVHFGRYFVLVTATNARNATATDSVLFERDPVKQGGGAAGPARTNKLVAPAAAPIATRRRPRGHLQGIP